MNCLSQVSSYTAAIFRTTGRSFGTGALYGPWKRKLEVYAGVKLISFESAVSRFRTQLYSSESKATSSHPRKKKSAPERVMDPEKDAFYVVRKGNVVGVYKSFADCQAEQGSSICDPPISVYKGYSMPKKDEQYLASCGLQNALYTISAADMKDELFGKLLDCPLGDPASSKGEMSDKTAAKKRSHQEAESENVEVIGSTSVSDTPSRKQAKKKAEVEVPPSGRGCTLQFDGASKGNPGVAGAGAVLQADDGTLVQGLWQVKNQNLSTLHEEVKKLKDGFVSFKISHVLRELNSEADAQANLAITLADGQVQEESGK